MTVCSIQAVRLYSEFLPLPSYFSGYSYAPNLFQQGGFQFKGVDTHLTYLLGTNNPNFGVGHI